MASCSPFEAADHDNKADGGSHRDLTVTQTSICYFLFVQKH